MFEKSSELFFEKMLYFLNRFLQIFQRSGVREAQESVRAERLAVGDDDVRVLQKCVGEVGGSFEAFAERSAHIGEGVKRAFGHRAFEIFD